MTTTIHQPPSIQKIVAVSSEAKTMTIATIWSNEQEFISDDEQEFISDDSTPSNLFSLDEETKIFLDQYDEYYRAMSEESW